MNPIDIVFILLMFAVVYFFMLRPTQKREKERDEFQANLEKGNDVVTASGIIGKINKLDERELTLETGNKTYLRITRNAISKEMTEAFFSEKTEKE